MKKIGQNEKGITLIALVISVIVMLILAGVSLNATIGENGVLTQAKKATFIQEMTSLEESIELKRVGKYVDDLMESSENTLFDDSVSGTIAEKFPDTLIAEIYFTRHGMSGGVVGTKTLLKQKTYKIILENFKLNAANFTDILYYVDEDTALGKSETYVYDTKTKIAYKIDGANMEGETYHSLVYYNMIANGDTSWVDGGVVASVDTRLVTSTKDGNTVYAKPYEPDINGFTAKTTSVVYYTKTGTQYVMSLDDYISKNAPRMIDASGQAVAEGNDNESTYYLYDYANQIWANVKCTGTNEKGATLETWWTWIPRYAYHLDSSTNKTTVLFVDLSGNYVQSDTGNSATLTEGDGYSLHEAFAQNGGLKGIWASKYPVSESEASSETIAPNFDNFIADKTDILAFSESGQYIRIPSATYSALFAGVADNDYSVRSVIVNGSLATVSKDSIGTYVGSVGDQISNSNGTLTAGSGTTETEFYIYNYAKKIWANCITYNNGMECYWVWIPRYAYSLDTEKNATEVIFVYYDSTTGENKPVDSRIARLPSFYTVHEAFEQDGNHQQGIWVSKYDVSYAKGSGDDAFAVVTNKANDMNLNDDTAVSASKVSIKDALDDAYAADSGAKVKFTYYTEDGKSTAQGSYINISSLKSGDTYTMSSVPETISSGGRTYYKTRYDAAVYPVITIYNSSNKQLSSYTWYPRVATRTVSQAGTQLRIDRVYVDISNKPVDTTTYGESVVTGNGFTIDSSTFGTGVSGYWK